VLITAESV